MLKFSKKSNVKEAIDEEKKLIDSYKNYEVEMKETIDKYLKEFKNVSFDNEALRTMLLNSFENALLQLDNNLYEIENLYPILDALESKKSVSIADIESYNKLFEKSHKNVELTQKFLQKTLNCFENVTFNGKKSSLSILEECKKSILADLPFTLEDSTKSAKDVLSSNLLKKKFDYTSSDLLCFFPKTKKDNLVLSIAQENYTVSFMGETAKISVEDESFNISLNTPGVQISNTTENNILFVSHSGSKYTIVTNNQMEIPSFVQISKISKNDDFLEVELICDSLKMNVENNIINFENLQEEVAVDNSLVEEPIGIIENAEKPTVKEEIIDEPKQATKKSSNDSKPVETVIISPDEIKDNDTLLISDKTKTVFLPYKVEDLEKKLEKSKNYKTLKDVIDKEYTIPLSEFKSPSKSRYREAYHLMREKEHGSIKEAIGLGFEVMFQSDLNPAIIAACRNLDELDIYLDCLDDKEPEKFSCFKIKYDVPPAKK